MNPNIPKSQMSQTTSEACLVVYVKELEPTDVVVEFHSDSIKVITSKIGKGGVATINHTWVLPAAINPDCSTYTVTKYKIEIKLAKVDSTIIWDDISSEGSEKKNSDTLFYGMDKLKSEKILSELQEIEEQKKNTGNPDDLFKSIFSNADENTRRAMVKSYQTSGGTVLSTNWEEVKDADYEKEHQERIKSGEFKKL